MSFHLCLNNEDWEEIVGGSFVNYSSVQFQKKFSDVQNISF